jgi:putative Holliday junction resolvase
MNGSLGAGAENAKQFAEKLRLEIPSRVVLWDERLSTQAAERVLRESGKKTRNTRGVIDQVAAQMILQGYLDRLNA